MLGRFFRYYYRQYNQFRKEKILCAQSQIKIYNFWSLNKSEDLWFDGFFKHRSVIPMGKELSIYSVFGPRIKMKLNRQKPKIFFTGENPSRYPRYKDHCLNDVALSLGFDNIKADNYMRFPLWHLYFIKPWFRLEGIQQWIAGVERTCHDTSFFRRKFCSMVAGHDPSGNRKEVFDLMSQFGLVSSGGGFLRNTDELKTTFQDNKLRFLEQFQFNIALENSDREGYVTEKIFQAVEAGCIPIYWGSRGIPEPDILNQNRILFYDAERPDLLKEKITSLRQEGELEAFLKQPVFKPGAALIIEKRLDELEQRVKQLFL